MNIEEVRDTCLSFKGTSEDVKWETNLTFLVADKIFAMTSLETVPTRLTLKVPSENFHEFVERDNIIQAPYYAKGQWINILDISLEKRTEIELLIKGSYQLVKAKLTKKKQLEISNL